MLNALNKPYFNPASAAGVPLGMTHDAVHRQRTGSRDRHADGGGATNATGNSQAGTSADSFRLTGLLGDNTARIIQLVFRVRW